jgi:hypothetical protein
MLLSLNKPITAAPRRYRFVALALCIALISLFAILAWHTAKQESATADEPVYVLSGWLNRNSSDFRLNTEHPPLWKRYAATPNRGYEVSLDSTNPLWTQMNHLPENEWDYTRLTLFQTPLSTAGDMLMPARAMMLPLGVLLAVILGTWAWQLTGPAGAVAACTLFCLDPNFIAHAPLVVNDVPLALVVCAVSYALWLAGRNITWKVVIVLPVLVALGPNIKATGLLLGPIATLILFIRALAPWPWSILGKPITSRLTRIIIAVSLCIAMTAATVLITWASYGFRFDPTPDPAIQMDTQRLLNIVREYEISDGHFPTPADAKAATAAWTPGLFLQADLFAMRNHLLPQAYLFGLIFNYATTRGADAFLLGSYAHTGWWYYFPLAFFMKTPLTSLLVIAATIGALGMRSIRLLRQRRTAAAKTNNPAQPANTTPPPLWLAVCVGIPLIAIGFFILTSKIDIGFRYVLPLMPLIYIAVSVAIGRLWSTGLKGARVGLIGLMLALAVETAAAYPYYISYFNIAAGGWRGGIDKLGDSNLDWGQDLLRLRDWQQSQKQNQPAGKNPPPLYFAYAYPGSIDPRYYGITFYPLLIPTPTGARLFLPHGQADLAVSAAMLQGTTVQGSPSLASFFAYLRTMPPDVIVGSTIYVYHVTPQSFPLP